MKDLKSRVEALEQVSFQHTPQLKAKLSQLLPQVVCSQGFPPSCPALFLTPRWPHAAVIPAALHTALPAQQPFEGNQSPTSYPTCYIPPGGPAGWERTCSSLPFCPQKLQLVLAPFHDLMPSAPEDVGTDPISRLSHSLQQLDRIDSLSEQISFLEERLETCKCLDKKQG